MWGDTRDAPGVCTEDQGERREAENVATRKHRTPQLASQQKPANAWPQASADSIFIQMSELWAMAKG